MNDSIHSGACNGFGELSVTLIQPDETKALPTGITRPAVDAEGAAVPGGTQSPRELAGKRVVLATIGSPGDVQPYLAIGQALQSYGHSPVVATSEYYRPLVERSGLDFAPIRPNRSPLQKDPDFLERLGSTARTPAALFRDMFMPDLRSSTADMIDATRGADCVVVHTLVAGGRLAAEVHGIPWVSAVMQPMGYLSVHEPPVIGPDWIAALLRRVGAAGTRKTYAMAKAVSGSWLRDWHLLRRELQLPETAEHPIWEGQHSPSRSLGLFPEVLGTPQLDWPVTARVTGFPAYRPASRQLHEDLQAFLLAGEAPVVFTLGTTAVNDPGSFYEVGARAARDLGLRSVLVMGNGVDRRLNARDDRAFVVDYAPHDLLFPHARVVVHQAGIGTLSEALLAGKPMLIMPYGHDQADNAWRASRLGVARVLTRRRFNDREVANSLRVLTEDPAIRANSARVAKAIARDNGAHRAAEFIEAVLAGSNVRTPVG